LHRTDPMLTSTFNSLNITTEAQLNTWLQTVGFDRSRSSEKAPRLTLPISKVWFPNTTAAQRAQILKNYPADVTQGVSDYSSKRKLGALGAKPSSTFPSHDH
jgi:hypothetical protein